MTCYYSNNFISKFLKMNDLQKITKLSTLVIATQNPAKLNSYKALLANFAQKVLGLSDFNITDKPNESGVTAEENAEIKAQYYSELTNQPVFCEDEALYVDFLSENEQPGVFVRRIAGRDEISDEELLRHWEKLILKAPKDRRTGRWHIAYALALPDERIRIASIDAPIVFFSPSSKIQFPG